MSMVTQTIVDLRMFSPAERFVVLFKAHILRMTITKLHIDDWRWRTKKSELCCSEPSVCEDLSFLRTELLALGV